MEIIEAFKQLNEDMNLYKGIFWIRDDLEELENNKDYLILILCDKDGNVSPELQLNLTSKNRDTHNHEYYWNNLMDAKLKNNKKFDYYPRGRVEISNGKATIYLNPNIYSEEIKNFIIKNFNLYTINGINEVRMIADNSNHYKCHLDL